jgi:hypothetical protein
MTDYEVESQRLAHRAEQVLAAARNADTSAAALEAFVETLGWNDALSARELTADEHARLRQRICATSQALLELGLSGLRSPPIAALVSTADTLATLLEVCRVIDSVVFISETLDEPRQWVVLLLAWAEQLASTLRTAVSQGQLLLVHVTEAGYSLIHTCKTSAEQLPGLAARFEALWTRWVDAAKAHPTVGAALAMRELVRQRGWRYAEIVSQARALAERDNVPVDCILEWILGSAPFPFGRSDDGENRHGRNGYAHSGADTVAAALAVLDVGPDDTFYDLGSGLGLPCVVAALRSEAACRGVEFHACYVERARENARHLGLESVEFFVGDVATFDWSDGNKFYMFNPFPEAVLQAVAARLLQLAARKPIRIACFHNALPEGFRRIGGEGKIAVYEAGAASAPHG